MQNLGNDLKGAINFDQSIFLQERLGLIRVENDIVKSTFFICLNLQQNSKKYLEASTFLWINERTWTYIMQLLQSEGCLLKFISRRQDIKNWCITGWKWSLVFYFCINTVSIIHPLTLLIPWESIQMNNFDNEVSQFQHVESTQLLQDVWLYMLAVSTYLPHRETNRKEKCI